MYNDEYSNLSIELCSYIPDNSSETSDSICSRLGNVDCEDVDAFIIIIGRLNSNNQRNVRTNKNYK